MKDKFDEQFSTYINGKKQILIPTKAKYDEMVATIQKCADHEPSHEDVKLVKRYTVHIEQQTPVLFHQGELEKENAQRVVYQEALYNLLSKSHKDLGHGGIDVMWKDLRDYYGISKEIIGIFVKICEDCQLKRGRPKKGLVVRPIISNDRNSRCQMDLIDLQSCPADGYKFILVYQDHLTKFVVLRALQQKCAWEVAGNLNEIFGTFGAPRILQSDNGREFVNQVIKNLLLYWPNCQIVHGRPRHSQSQGSVERCNLDIQRILSTHLRDYPNQNWAQALPLVQVAKNRRFHRFIGRSTYEAMFGKKLTMGNEDGNIPSREERGLPPKMDEQFPSLCLEPEEFGEESPDQDWSELVLMAKSKDPNYYPPNDDDGIGQDLTEDNNDDESETETADVEELDKRDENIQEQRAGARASQRKNAEAMMEESNKRFAPLEVGMSVRIPVDPVDRPKLGQPNLMGVVLDINENGLYLIGTRSGRLPHRFSRNQLEPCENEFIDASNVPDKEVAFRTAVGAESVTGSQGHRHCMCTTGCTSRKCACRKAGRICNSRCHHNNNCQNKDGI